MATVNRGATAFPVFALVLGAIGAPLLGLGVLGLFAPEAATFLPMLRESTIATTFVAVGAVLMAIELMMLLPWLRRRNRE